MEQLEFENVLQCFGLETVMLQFSRVNIVNEINENMHVALSVWCIHSGCH